MKLSKVKFLDASNAQELSKEEQKLIWGGNNGRYCCWWESQYDYGCITNPYTAYFMGTYHWECRSDLNLFHSLKTVSKC